MTDPVLRGRGTRGFAWLVVKLRFAIVLAWVGGAIAATLYLPSLSEGGGAPLLVAENSESVETRERSLELFAFPLLAEVAVVQRDAKGLTAGAQERVFRRAAGILERPGQNGIAFALPITNTDRLFPASRERSTTAITYLFFEPGTDIADQRSGAQAFADSEIGQPDDHLVGVTGAVPARLTEFDRIDDALPLVEIATIALIAVILALTYRSAGAPVVTLVSAGLAFLVANRVVPWVGEQTSTSLPREIEPLVVVLLLGIVTDYAIFFLSGLRARLVAGDPRLDASRRSTAENLPIVLTAGLIVAAGTATLVAGRLEFFQAIGPGLALTALIGVAASVTLIPALLAIFGRAVFWPSRASVVPAQGEARASAAVVADAPECRGWRERIALFATARPVAALIVLVSVGALVAAATGLRDLNLGFTNIQGLPADAEARFAAEAAQTGFAAGILAPTELLVEAPGIGERRDALVRLEELLDREDGVAGIVGPREQPADIRPGAVLSNDGNAARYAIVLDHEALGSDAIDRLEAIEDALPSLVDQAGLAGASFALAGDTALAQETVSSTVSDLQRIGIAALGVNLLALVIFLRSLVAPLFLLTASVLALGATLGLTTYLFQELLGYGELTYFVPFAAAVLLLSLGSDYNVFVVGRVWQEAKKRPLREAVATAVPRASKTITVAGLALAASFALLAIVPLRAFRELAFALAVGVLIDAFVVRSLLVPALISLFGDASWWPGRRRILRWHAPHIRARRRDGDGDGTRAPV